MLESRVLTSEEVQRRLEEVRDWLRQAQDEPVEGMAEFFARRIGQYEDVHLGRWAEEYAHIADYFEDGMQTLLDIGCGTGLELAALFRRFPRLAVTGVDLSEPMLRRLREHYAGRNLTLVQADYFTHPFGERAFDAALSFETLHHFPAEKKLALYRKLFRAVKAGGCYVECDYVACCEEEEALCRAASEARRRSADVPEERLVHLDTPLTLEHQRELMRRAGARSVETLYQNGSTAIFKAIVM